MGMLISIVNFTKKLKDDDVQKAIRAVNHQIALDFEPYWHMGARLRLEGAGTRMNRQSPQELRGDAIIYLWDKAADVDDAVGYHDKNNGGLPYGFVFTQIAEELEEPWSVTLSHEALELIGDPEVNVLVAGRHPKDRRKTVYFWYEMCDAVQDDRYSIDGVEVSNFVLPLYFTLAPEVGSRNDFLGRRVNGKLLESFGFNPGGYVGFFDPALSKDVTIAADERAEQRLKIKEKLGRARRSVRYRSLDQIIAAGDGSTNPKPGKESAGNRLSKARRAHA
jgi:hypothetical protein